MKQLTLCTFLLAICITMHGQEFHSLIATGHNKKIEWKTSLWGNGFGHRINSFDAGGKTLLSIDARHNTTTWSPLMVFTSNGKIGIGTNDPSAKLDIFGNNSNTTNLILAANYIDKYRWRLKTKDRGAAIDLDFTASDGGDIEESVLKLTRSNSGRPEFHLHNNAIVANNGSIGIGTDTPDANLDVFTKITI